MNLQEETRNGYTISAEMKAVWAVQLKMAKYLLDVCKKYNLKIWADGGTLLGTVREKGYIPWDDDIDMLMPRADYDKLISIADKEFKAPYHLQSFGRARNYYRGHAQMRCDGTTAILPPDLWQPFHQGIFIDIFVYDTIPNRDCVEWEEAINRADLIQHTLKSLSFRGKLTSPKYLLESLKSNIYCFFQGRKKLIKEYEDLFRQFDTPNNTRIAPPCFFRTNLDGSIKEKEWYRETIFLPFEDMLMPVPIGYDLVLRTQYGEDYMIPKRAPSIHGEVIFDTTQDYKQVLKSLRRQRILQKIGVLK